MSETVEVDGLQVNPETGEVVEEPSEIEKMIAATMTPEEGDGDGEPEPNGEEARDGTDDGEQNDGEPQLTAEDYERQAAEHAEVRASMKAQEKAFKARDTRVDTFTKYMEQWAVEQEQPLVRCPVCIPETPGFIFHPAHVALTQDQLNACNILAGNPLMPDYKTITEAQPCPKCNGEGMVLTGSKVTGKTTIKCPECRGDGWVGEVKNLTPEQAARPELVPPDYVAEDAEVAPDLDPWGTPHWDPEYDKMPRSRTPGWDNGTGVWVHPDQRVS